MKFSLLVTKTHLPPVPEYYVPRPRLEQRLDAALHGHQRLILLSAPPGSGKSSLLAAWAARRTQHLAWFTLESDDNETAQFWSYFLAAILPRFEDIPRSEDLAQRLLEDLSSASNIPPALLPVLVNLLCSRAEPLSIVLDDYHVIENLEIQQGILYLIEHLPAQTCLVITTRIDPPLPLHRWRARGQMTEIRAADLRFTLEEARTFLTHQMGLDLELDDVQKLEERTEGWATGLQLAALSLQGHPDPTQFIAQFSGSQRFILDYLMNEVFVRQSEEVQRFLLRTSILESMCSELCDAVIENSEKRTESNTDRISDSQSSFSASILIYLDSANLFLTPLDDEPSEAGAHTWFRYQHLFGDFLRQRLKRQGQSPHDLHQRAANWYADNGYIDEAIRHALVAENATFALDLIRKHWLPVASEGRTHVVARWMEMLPAPVLAEDGQMSLMYAWMLLSIGKMNSLEPQIQNAIRAVGNATDPDLAGQLVALRAILAASKGDLAATSRLVEETQRYSRPENGLIRGLVWLAQANLQREVGDFSTAISAYQHALPLLPANGILMGTLTMIVYLGQAYEIQGQVQAAEELYQSHLRLAVERGKARAPAIGLLQIQLARIEYERNHLAEAHALFTSGKAASQLSGIVELIQRTAILDARLCRSDGDLPGAIQRLEEALGWVRSVDALRLWMELSAWLARLQAESGDLRKAQTWVGEVRLCPDHNPGYTRGVELFSQVRVLICLGQLDEALRLARKLEVLAIQAGSMGRVVESRMLLAEILWKQGQPEKALECLNASLALSESAGLARLYLDEGNRLAPLFAIAKPSGFAAWLLECFRKESGSAIVGKALSGEVRSLANENIALTARELDVLRGLIAGLSYPEIAERLVISPGTVKTHVSHIYAKLGVQGRIEAIHRAQELKIA